MDPITGLISIGGSLLGGLFGASNQERANQQSMELARYNWANQKAMYEDQKQYNLDMWNRNNEYNSPTAQMARLKEAGLNPNLVYGNGATATSQGPASAPSAPTPQLPHLGAYTNYGDFGLSNAINQMMAFKRAEADINKTNQETDNLAVYQDSMQRDIRIKDLQAISLEYANAKTETEKEFWRDVMVANLDYTYAGTTQRYANAKESDSRRFLNEQQKDFNELKFPMQLTLLKANIANELATTRLKGANADQIVRTTEKIGLEIERLKATYDDYVEKYGYERATAEFESEIRRFKANNPYLSGNIMQSILGAIDYSGDRQYLGIKYKKF